MSSTLYIDPKCLGATASQCHDSPRGHLIFQFAGTRKCFDSLTNSHHSDSLFPSGTVWQVSHSKTRQLSAERFPTLTSLLRPLEVTPLFSKVRSGKYILLSGLQQAWALFWTGSMERNHFFSLYFEQKWYGGFKSQQSVLIRSPAIPSDV